MDGMQSVDDGTIQVDLDLATSGFIQTDKPGSSGDAEGDESYIKVTVPGEVCDGFPSLNKKNYVFPVSKERKKILASVGGK